MARHHSSSAHPRLVVVGAATFLAASTAALAADTAKEIATAAQHADLAATAADIKMVKAHLHHTINCLVGPNGDHFDAKELNPCQDLGNGAIPDTIDAAKKKSLEAAFKTCMSGLTAHDPAGAKAIAGEAEALIKSAM
jgi:hypothetical protein